MRSNFVAREMVKWVLDEDRRLEGRLRELLERQRLSRFDTLMFLLYPATIAAFTALASSLWQIGTLRNFQVFAGLTAANIVLMLATLLIIFICGLVLFAHAYACDSVRERIEAAGLLALGVILVGGPILLLIGVVTLLGSASPIGIPPSLQGYELWFFGLGALALVAWILLLFAVAYEVQGYVQRSAALWFMQNLRFLCAKENLVFGQLPRWHHTYLAVLWFAICLPSYALAIAYVSWLVGLFNILVDCHYLAFVALFVASTFLVFRRLTR
jgi:hypothetical protein